jgi:hypothetical protein
MLNRTQNVIFFAGNGMGSLRAYYGILNEQAGK